MTEERLRFRIRRGAFEVELEGSFQYVREKFEQLLRDYTPSLSEGSMSSGERVAPSSTLEELSGILEATPDGKPHFTIPFDAITAKEAIGLILYMNHPDPMDDEELSRLLSSSWKTTKAEAVRARASELRRDGKLISEGGRYRLSGAGLQWIRGEVLTRLMPTPGSSTI